MVSERVSSYFPWTQAISKWTDLLLQQVSLFGKPPSECILLKPCRGQRKKTGGFSLPSLHTSPWAPSVHAPEHPQGNHVWPALLSHHTHLPKETSPALTALTGISSPAILLLSCLHQQIIHPGGTLPGFMAIQTFEQMMLNIDKIWVSLQCKCITPIPRGTSHSSSSHFLKLWITVAHHRAYITNKGVYRKWLKNTLLQSVSLIQQSFRVG